MSRTMQGSQILTTASVSSVHIAILTIDHPGRRAFDDRFRRSGYGYDRLRIDDLLRKALYRPVRFEFVPDLLAASDAHPFDMAIVQSETPCVRTLEAIRTLRARFSDSMPILLIAQRDDGASQALSFQAGANECLPCTSSADRIVMAVSTWLRWAHFRSTHRRRWRIAGVDVDTANRCIRLGGKEHFLTEKHFQIVTALLANLGRDLGRAHLSQLVWGSLVAASNRRIDTHMANLRDRLGLDGRHGLRLTSVHGYGYRLVECELREPDPDTSPLPGAPDPE
ncbi:response regulator transcription factor [Burkholderia multivorans]|uniref:response regulator transcription factor n=1 Tax=Burkholderia multivorans TaxID=87883 RepID=UPI002158A66F|nr:response regulator transcription factor [Burkholderia multivorans]